MFRVRLYAIAFLLYFMSAFIAVPVAEAQRFKYATSSLVVAERIFKTMDDNRDAHVDMDELKHHHREFFDYMDRNGNGAIVSREVQTRGKPQDKFKALDADKNGSLSFDESFAIERQRFLKADVDQDNRVSFHEFIDHVRMTPR